MSWIPFPEFGTLIQPVKFLKDIHTYDYIRAAYGLQKIVMDIVNQYDAFLKKIHLGNNGIEISGNPCHRDRISSI